MKKNLISIAILALLIVNIVLTSIMMISVTSTNKKTAALVSDIAAAIELDLGSMTETAAMVPMEKTVTHTISDLTILLKKSTVINEDGVEVESEKDHYALISVTLSMNSEHEDYATYGADIASREDLIKGVINSVVRKYTMEEASANTQLVEDELLEEIQKLFGSDFVYDVTLPKWLPQ